MKDFIMTNYSYKTNPINDLKQFFASKTVLPRIMLGCLFGAILCLLSVLIGSSNEGFKEFIENYLALSAEWKILIKRPWTLVTYVFLSFNFFSFLFGFVVLGYFGLLFCRYLGHRRFVIIFFSAAIASALFYVLLNTFFDGTFLSHPYFLANLLPPVFAVFSGITYYLPNHPVRFPIVGDIKLKYVAWFFVAIELYMVFSGNAAEHATNIFSAFVGVAYIYLNRKHNQKTLFRLKPKRKLKARGTSAHSRPLTDEQYNGQRAERQKEIDRILDKIAESGYSSLTEKEKQILFESSKK